MSGGGAGTVGLEGGHLCLGVEVVFPSSRYDSQTDGRTGNMSVCVCLCLVHSVVCSGNK